MEHEMNLCEKCEDLLQPYLDRELSGREREEVRAHLEDCGYCAKHYRFEETLWRHVRGCCCSEEMRPELKERLASLRVEL